MICPNCKSNIPDDSKFCPDCGTPVKNEEELRRKAKEIVTMYPKGYDYFVKYQSFPHFVYNITAENCEKIIAKMQDIIKKHNEIVAEERRRQQEQERQRQIEAERRRRIEAERQLAVARQREAERQQREAKELERRRQEQQRNQHSDNVGLWIVGVFVFIILVIVITISVKSEPKSPTGNTYYDQYLYTDPDSLPYDLQNDTAFLKIYSNNLGVEY